MAYIISTQGLEAAANAVEDISDKTEKNLLATLSKGAREFRTEFINDISAGTGLKKSVVRAGTRVDRATKKNGVARIVSSSKGLPITEYTWRHENAGHPTRARVLIRWFGAWRVVPGFVNQEAGRPLPMKTLPGKKGPVLAHGLSIAAAFKVVRDDGRAARLSERLAEIFTENLQD